MSSDLVRRCLVECLGTAFLGYVIIRSSHPSFDVFQQAFLVGLTLSLLIHCCGRFSGAHFNPAVTLMFHFDRYRGRAAFSSSALIEPLAYGFAQCLGAWCVFRFSYDVVINAPFALSAAVPEFIFSLVLLFLIFVWSTEGRLCPVSRPITGFVIGSGLVPLILLGGLSGSGVLNPAIAFGLSAVSVKGLLPLVFSQFLAAFLIIIARPVLGVSHH